MLVHGSSSTKGAIKDWSDILISMGATIIKDTEFQRAKGRSCDYILALSNEKGLPPELTVIH